jgi:hypothetical protein
MSIQIKPTSDHRILVYTPFNKQFVDAARRAGGRWSAQDRAWLFAEELTETVRGLLRHIFGEDDTKAEVARVRLRCTFEGGEAGNRRYWPDRGGNLEVVLAGREVARAFHRDSGARLGPDVVLIQGRFNSGGSRANPRITVSDNTVVDLLRVPETMARRMVADHPEHFRIVASDGSEILAQPEGGNVVPFRGEA